MHWEPGRECPSQLGAIRESFLEEAACVLKLVDEESLSHRHGGRGHGSRRNSMGKDRRWGSYMF